MILASLLVASALADCPIPVTDFYSMNAFCDGRGIVAGVGTLPFVGGAPAAWGTSSGLPAPMSNLLKGTGEIGLRAEASELDVAETILFGTSSGTVDSSEINKGFFQENVVGPLATKKRVIHDAIESRYGLLREGGRTLGSLQAPMNDAGDHFVVSVGGCAMCHAGRVVDEIVPGLGNKLIDIRRVNALIQKYVRVKNPWTNAGDAWAVEPAESQGTHESDFVRRALRTTRRMEDQRWGNRARGLLSDAYIMWWVRGHARAKAPAMKPLVSSPGRGEVKIPNLWNFDLRRGECSEGHGLCDVPLFADGVAASRDLLAGAELGGDPSPNAWRSAASQLRRQELERMLVDQPLQPPPYPCPGDLDEAEVRRGHTLYRTQIEGARSCMSCHGDPERPEDLKMVAFDRVGTDRERVRMIADCSATAGYASGVETDECRTNREAFDILAANTGFLTRSRWKDEADDGLGAGYFAPRLNGIWARFPYLHNGSVPTVDHLLGPPGERPLVFDLTDASKHEGFDRAKLGLVVSPDWSARAGAKVSGGKVSTGGERNLYYVAWWRKGEMGCETEGGCWANRGHALWGADGIAPRERQALLAYLKTIGSGVAAKAKDWCRGP